MSLSELFSACEAALHGSADFPQNPSEALSISSAVQQTLQNNFEIQIGRIAPQIERSRELAGWGAFDPILELGANFEKKEYPLNAQQQSASGLDSGVLERPDDRSIRDIFEKNETLKGALLWKNPLGSELEIAINPSEQRSTYNEQLEGALFQPEYNSTGGVKLTQPFLRNFGFEANLAEIRVSRTNKKIAQLGLAREISEKLSEMLGSYYELSASRRDLAIKQRVTSILDKMIEEFRTNQETGVRSEQEIGELELERGRLAESALNAEIIAQEKIRDIARLLYSQQDALAGRIVAPIDPSPTDLPTFSKQELIATAFKSRPDYLAAVQEAEKRNIQLKFEKNQALPKLDAVATFGYNGLGADYNASLDYAFAQKRDEYWSVGATLSIPLGRIAGKNRVDAARYEEMQAILKIRDAESAIHIEIDSALRVYDLSQRRLETMRRTSGAARKLYETEQSRLEAGEVAPANVVGQLRALLEATGRERVAEIEVQKSALEVRKVSGTLLEYLKVKVE